MTVKTTPNHPLATESRGNQSATNLTEHDEGTALFHLEFGKSCLEEARTFDPRLEPAKRLEFLNEAQSYLHSALEFLPTHPTIHHQLGVVAVSKGEFTQALNSFRTAVIYAPEPSVAMMSDLQVTSRIVEQENSGSISSGAFAVQDQLAKGRPEEAFSASLADANHFLARGGDFDRWSVQLMRIAAIATNNEKVYADYLLKFEDCGLIGRDETEFHPKAFQMTDDLRSEMLDDDSPGRAAPQRSKVWDELGKRREGVTPINRVAVVVSARPLEGMEPIPSSFGYDSE